MQYKDLQDKDIFHWFYEISQIPRQSGQEKQISDFLVNFAKERNLEVSQDKANNVIIRKPASKGYENNPTVCLQGHMDMVAVKESDSDHDFSKNPIKLLVEDGWIRAEKTTLGADNGIAVAYALAILDDKNVEHGPLEVLITTDEERGMTGAMEVKGSDLKAKYLLNLDSEEEGILTVGCAGGIEAEISFKKELEEKKGHFIKVEIDSLEGGHSGMEIDKFRANAIKQLARLIVGLKDYQIGEIKGGIKRNAIAADASAIVLVEDKKSAYEILEKVKEEIIHEYKNSDPDASISIEDVEFDKQVMTKDSSKRLVQMLYVMHDGLYKKNLELNSIITSSNLGVLEDRDDQVHASVMIRSEINSDKMYRANMIKVLAESFGASVNLTGQYPGWEKEESELLEISKRVWKNLTGNDQEIATTHGGLECGLLKDKMKDTQMISFGPETLGAHSPKERLNIESAQRNYKFLKELLKEIK